MHSSGTGSFLCMVAGVYSFNISSQVIGTSGTNSVMIRGTQNGVEIPGSQTYEALLLNTAVQSVRQAFMANFAVGDTFAFQFAGTNTSVTLTTADFTPPSVAVTPSASLSIIKVA